MTRLILVLGLLLVGGCQTLAPLDPHGVGRRLNGAPMVVGDWNASFTAALPASRGAVAREFAFAKMSESDRRCEDYLVGISAGNNGFGAIMDLASIGLSLVGSGTSSLANANDLAKGTGILQSLRSTATNNLLAGQEFALIYDTVHAGRLAERAKLIEAIDGGEFDSWGPEGILSVMNAYDVKCGVNYAAMLIREAIAKNPPSPTVALPPGADGTSVPQPAPDGAAVRPQPGTPGQNP